MAIFSNYTDLRLNVVRYFRRNDIDPDIERLVIMAEDRLNRNLRHVEMLKTGVAVSLVGGIGVLPADFLEMQSVYDATGKSIDETTTFLPQDRCPAGYYISGTSIRYGNGTADLTCEYFGKLPTLTASATTTNWLLSKHPSVYLYAVLVECADFLGDDRASGYGSRLKSELRDVKIDSDRRQFGRANLSIEGLAP